MQTINFNMSDQKKIFLEYWNEKHSQNILFIHGGPGSGSFEFRHQAKIISSYANIILFDQRGCLRSDALEEQDIFSTDILLKDMEDIRLQLNISKLILLGHSYGGQLALLYALKYPENISKIIYVCPSFYLFWSLKEVFQRVIRLLEDRKENSLANFLKEVEQNAKEALDYLKALPKIPLKIREEVYYEHHWSRQIKEVIYNIDASENDWRKGQKQQDLLFKEGKIWENYLPKLSKINKPSLLIVGEYDPICNFPQIETFKKASSQNQVAIIPKGGHSPYNDQPLLFNKVVKNFIE